MRQPIGSVELEVEWRTTARSEVDEEGGNDILEYMGVAAMDTDALLSPSEAVGSGAASTSGSPPEAPLKKNCSVFKRELATCSGDTRDSGLIPHKTSPHSLLSYDDTTLRPWARFPYFTTSAKLLRRALLTASSAALS